MLKYVRWAALLVATLLCMLTIATPAFADSTPNTFKTLCSFNDAGQFDPIVHPTQNPFGHIHDFFASTAITSSSTGYTLQAQGNGTDSCADDRDTAGYWAPQLYANGTAVQPTSLVVYYERIPNLQLAAGDACSPLESCTGSTIDTAIVPHTDFRLIAGNSNATGQQPIYVEKWACSDNSLSGPLPPACPTKQLIAHITFPSCWNGSDALQANNTQAARYPTINNNVATCPAGYDVQIPRLEMEIHYDLQPTEPSCSPMVTTNCITYNLSAENPADPTATPVLGSIDTLHADWMNGWQTDASLGISDPFSFDELIRRCDNGPNGTPACGVITSTPLTNTTPPVSSSPTGPVTPTDGWRVEYANGFGDCLSQVATGCSTGAPHDDNTLYALDGNMRPSSTDEPTVYNASQATVDSNGLELSCDYAPAITAAANYSCAEVESGGTAPIPAGIVPFQFSPGQGETWVWQMVAKMPPNTQDEDPAFWSSSLHWNWEIDFPEAWGWGPASSGWCGDSMGFPAIPRINGPFGGQGQGDVTLCQGEPYDPSTDYHTYTVEMSGQTFYAWVDGQPVAWSNTRRLTPAYVWSTERGGLILQQSLRNEKMTNNTSFTSGTRTLSVRSIAVYENASALDSDTTNAGIAPGTTVQ